jgi:hypothetical protein
VIDGSKEPERLPWPASRGIDEKKMKKKPTEELECRRLTSTVVQKRTPSKEREQRCLCALEQRKWQDNRCMTTFSLSFVEVDDSSRR